MVLGDFIAIDKVFTRKKKFFVFLQSSLRIKMAVIILKSDGVLLH